MASSFTKTPSTNGRGLPAANNQWSQWGRKIDSVGRGLYLLSASMTFFGSKGLAATKKSIIAPSVSMVVWAFGHTTLPLRGRLGTGNNVAYSDSFIPTPWRTPFRFVEQHVVCWKDFLRLLPRFCLWLQHLELESSAFQMPLANPFTFMMAHILRGGICNLNQGPRLTFKVAASC